MTDSYKAELKTGIWDNVKDMAKKDPAIMTDVIGIFDPTGTADLVSAGIRVAKGDWWGALFSVVSAIPFGDIIRKTKLLSRYGPKGVGVGKAVASYFGKSSKAFQDSLVAMKGARPPLPPDNARLPKCAKP